MTKLILPITFIALSLTFSAKPLYAQDKVLQLSLDECTQYALKHNASSKNAMLDVLIQQAQNAQVTASAYPHISSKTELDDFINPQVSYFPNSAIKLFNPSLQLPDNGFQKVVFTPKYSGSSTISGSQILFDGSVMIALKARNTVLEFARTNAEVTQEGIRYSIFKVYHALAITYRQYDIVKSALTYARSLERDLLITQQNGLAEKIEVERTNVQVNNLASDSMRIGNLLTVTEQLLKYQMGIDINTPIVLSDTNVDARKQEINSLLDKAMDYNRVPEYRLMETGLKLNEYNVTRYKMAALPTLLAFGNIGYGFSSNDFGAVTTLPNYLFNSILGFQLNIPIFNGMLRVKQLQEAKLNVEKMKNNIDNIKLGIDFQTAQSRANLRNAILQVQNQHRNLDLANDVLDLAQKKYKAGVGSSQEITLAQTDHLQAQTNYFNALMDMINAEADLKKALGLLK
jgi:outer membrane protein TolC